MTQNNIKELENNFERAVFLKNDPVLPREASRYIWANEHLLGKNILEIGCSSGYGIQFLPNDIFKINVPILTFSKGLIVGFILNNNSWYDGNVQIYLFNNKYYELSPLIIGRTGAANLARGIYRYPKGFFIPDVTSFVKYDNNGMMYIEIIVDNSKDINSTNIRGIYTELVEPN